MRLPFSASLEGHGAARKSPVKITERIISREKCCHVSYCVQRYWRKLFMNEFHAPRLGFRNYNRCRRCACLLFSQLKPRCRAVLRCDVLHCEKPSSARRDSRSSNANSGNNGFFLPQTYKNCTNWASEGGDLVVGLSLPIQFFEFCAFLTPSSEYSARSPYVLFIFSFFFTDRFRIQ